MNRIAKIIMRVVKERPNITRAQLLVEINKETPCEYNVMKYHIRARGLNIAPGHKPGRKAGDREDYLARKKSEWSKPEAEEKPKAEIKRPNINGAYSYVGPSRLSSRYTEL